jgi:iron complex transport system ATP-binding protein
MTALVEALGLAWRAGNRAVLGPLDLRLAAGECLAVLGPNGAGKTTLLRLLAGVLAPSAGDLAWRGTPYGALSRRELARRVAYVPQVRPARIPLTVAELVLLGRYPHLRRLQLVPAREDFVAVRGALEEVGIASLADRRLDELSGGERQAAFVAAALAQEAELLLLDEPTAHLDARHRREVAGILTRLARERGRTLVVATHDLEVAAALADRLVALVEGRAAASGSPEEVLRSEVLGEVFAAPFTVAGRRSIPTLELVS